MDYGHNSYQNGSQNSDTDFQRLSQTIATSIQKISQNVSSMQRMVNQLGTPQETTQLKNQLHGIQHYTQQLAKDTKTHLQELSKLNSSPNSSEQRQRKLLKERLTQDFTEALQRFQEAQRNAMQREKESLQRGRTNSAMGLPFNIDPPGGSALIDLQDNRQQKLTQQQRLEEELALQQLEEQERSIRQLENDITDVNQIFKDLGQLVHNQADIVDSIEAHIEMASTSVREGAQQLRMANESQRKLRKKKFCLVGWIFIVLIILILVIVLTSR